MSELPDEARGWIDDLRAEEDMPPEVASRIVERVEAAGSSTAGAGGLGGATKLAIGALVVTGAAAALMLGGRGEAPTPAVAPPAPEVAAAEPAVTAPAEREPIDRTSAAPPVEPPPAPAVESPRPRRARPSPAVAVEAESSGGDVEAELQLILQARKARKAGRAGDALRLTDEYLRAHPRGAFAGEATLIRVRSLCDAGRQPEANDLAARFLKREPGSPLADPLRTACPTGE